LGFKFPRASDTVKGETALGLSPSAGTLRSYSRGDHTHGTPPTPVPPADGGLGRPYDGLYMDRGTLVYDDRTLFQFVTESKDVFWDSQRRKQRFYAAAQVNALATVSGAPTPNILRAYPLFIGKPCTLDRIGVGLITPQPDTRARLGIYSDKGAYEEDWLYPDTRWAEVEVYTDGIGSPDAPINLPVASGLLWAVIVQDAAAPPYPTLRCLQLGGVFPILGHSSTADATPSIGWSVPYAYQPLPATFPVGASHITAIPVPRITVRSNWY